MMHNLKPSLSCIVFVCLLRQRGLPKEIKNQDTRAPYKRRKNNKYKTASTVKNEIQLPNTEKIGTLWFKQLYISAGNHKHPMTFKYAMKFYRKQKFTTVDLRHLHTDTHLW